MSIVERLGGFWWCKGMLFILRKDFGESMCEVSAKSVVISNFAPPNFRKVKPPIVKHVKIGARSA